jgi:DNA adenine methylase
VSLLRLQSLSRAFRKVTKLGAKLTTANTEARVYEGILKSPFKWVGGKFRLRNAIVDLLPEHKCYVEVFGGAAWVLFGKQPSQVEVLNDKDGELVNFFRVVKNRPKELIKSFEWELVSRAEFERLANLDASRLTDVERAHRFYYLIMAGWGGEANYPRFQTSVNDEHGHGNRLVGALGTLEKRLDPIHERLQTVIIENLDWRDCISRYDRKGAMMYLDPPYPGNSCNYRYNMREWKEHEELAGKLRNVKCKWILSSYDLPGIRDLFRGQCIIPVRSPSGMEARKNGGTRVMNKEVLIMNYEPAESQRHLCRATRRSRPKNGNCWKNSVVRWKKLC